MSIGISSDCTPVYVIDTTPPQPNRCPKCEKIENIISVCGHCGYKYQKDDNPMYWYYYVICLILIALFVWLIITLFYWLFGQGYSTDACEQSKSLSQWSMNNHCKETLRQILTYQFSFIKGAKF